MIQQRHVRSKMADVSSAYRFCGKRTRDSRPPLRCKRVCVESGGVFLIDLRVGEGCVNFFEKHSLWSFSFFLRYSCVEKSCLLLLVTNRNVLCSNVCSSILFEFQLLLNKKKKKPVRMFEFQLSLNNKIITSWQDVLCIIIIIALFCGSRFGDRLVFKI